VRGPGACAILSRNGRAVDPRVRSWLRRVGGGWANESSPQQDPGPISAGPLSRRRRRLSTRRRCARPSRRDSTSGRGADGRGRRRLGDGWAAPWRGQPPARAVVVPRAWDPSTPRVAPWPTVGGEPDGDLPSAALIPTARRGGRTRAAERSPGLGPISPKPTGPKVDEFTRPLSRRWAHTRPMR